MTMHQCYIIISAETMAPKLKLICFSMLVFVLTQNVLDALSQVSLFFNCYYNSS